MSKENVKLELVEEEKPKRKVPALVWGSLMMVAAGFIGYKFGGMVRGWHTGYGLNICFEKDPTLKEHMATVMSEIAKEKLMKS